MYKKDNGAIPSKGMDLIINSRLVIPAKELQWRFSRNSGPGGQNVNKTDSRVELIFDLEASSVLGTFLKKRLFEHFGTRLVAGYLRVVAADGRSQYQNRKLALTRMRNILKEGLNPLPKSRKATKPSMGAKKRRVDNKKQRGEVKRERQYKPSFED